MAVSTTDLFRTQRELEVGNALASVRMEGLEPSEEAKALFQRYVDGEMTSEELDRAFDRFIDRKYGPVRSPRDECS
jgi:hypothetical protein